jgi:hypothetical protein
VAGADQSVRDASNNKKPTTRGSGLVRDGAGRAVEAQAQAPAPALLPIERG